MLAAWLAALLVKPAVIKLRAETSTDCPTSAILPAAETGPSCLHVVGAQYTW